MTSTTIAFQALTRNLPQTLARVANSPGVKMSTAQFEKALGSVTSLDDFMNNDKVYRYVMDAYGLGDMAYAKAFVRKVLQEGVSSPDSMANRLSDARYRELAQAFDFATEAAETKYFNTNISKVMTVTGFTAPNAQRMFDYAIKAFGLESMADTDEKKEQITQALHLGSDSQIRFTDPELQTRFQAFLKTFDFADQGLKTTSDKAAMAQVVTRYNAVNRAAQQDATVEKYTRQQLEVQEGATDENVRLALYFSRKAPGLTNTYQILADPALLKVVQTALSIAPETSAMPIEKQAAMIEKKLDVKSLNDPDALKSFLLRFTALADSNGGASSNPTMLLFSQPSSALIGQDVLMSLQKLRLGGI